MQKMRCVSLQKQTSTLIKQLLWSQDITILDYQQSKVVQYLLCHYFSLISNFFTIQKYLFHYKRK